MMNYPLISVITSSFNQGQFIERTIQSVMSQHYPNIEHIIVDGQSTDQTAQILRQYPHLTVIREPDFGQADAINKGLKLAKGDILCFLNSDDTFYPGALHRVSEEIDPLKGRHIIVGRCRFIDENDQFLGVEHPSFFVNHRRVLEIWKGHMIPQPAVFWTREVLERCGMLDLNEHLVLDFDLFCRYSKHYHFFMVDQVLANYRLHTQSKTCLADEPRKLEESIRISRRYWGRFFSFSYMRLLRSLTSYRRKCYARSILKKAAMQRRSHDFLKTFYNVLLGSLIGPDITYREYIYPRLRRRYRVKIHNIQEYSNKMLQKYPKIKAYSFHSGIWPDQWAGPSVTLPINSLKPVRSIKIIGDMPFIMHSIDLSVFIQGKKIFTRHINKKRFRLTIPIPSSTIVDEINITTEQWIIMHHYTGIEDFRPLSWKLLRMHIIE